MDPANYKLFRTSRGLIYSYFFGQPLDPEGDEEKESRPTVLFLHGFPTSSCLWKHQVKCLRERGFVVLAPDLLGFGGSSKPCDPEVFRASLICRDIIELLDIEGFGDGTVIAIGHDLGSKIVARLANFYPQRCRAYGFIANPYHPPRPRKSLEYTLWVTKRFAGYELCGHALLYANADSDKLIEQHLDSFLNLMFADNCKLWCTDLAPVGALQSWLEQDRTTEVAKYVDPKDLRVWRTSISEQGIAASLCYYKAFVHGITEDDDKLIPVDLYHIDKPVFLAAALYDYVSPAVMAIAMMKKQCKNLTIREFYEGHWLMMASSAKLNEALYSWIMDFV